MYFLNLFHVILFFFRLGANKLNEMGGAVQKIGVAKIFIHEKYSNPKCSSHDIALIKLEEPAVLGNGVELVCLSDAGNQRPFDDDNGTCSTTGWGAIKFEAPALSPELREVYVPLLSKKACEKLSLSDLLDDSMLCAGGNGKGTCGGDSGGPLVCEFDGTWYLEGVTSWAIKCPDLNDLPTVFADVRYLKPWISGIINSSKSCIKAPQKSK